MVEGWWTLWNGASVPYLVFKRNFEPDNVVHGTGWVFYCTKLQNTGSDTQVNDFIYIFKKCRPSLCAPVFSCFSLYFLGRKTTKNIREKKLQLFFHFKTKPSAFFFKKIKRGFKSSTKISSVIIIQPKGE